MTWNNLKEKIHERWLFSPTVEWVHNHTIRPYYKYTEMLKRMIFWGWNMRWSWDFDAQTIYDVLLLKLKRLKESFDHEGHLCWQNPGDVDYYRMEALIRAIELCDKLANRDDYDYIDGLMEAHDEKWGELKTNMSEPSPEDHKDGYIVFRCWRAKAVTKEEKELERKEYVSIMSTQYAARESDTEEFFKILNKHIKGWWD